MTKQRCPAINKKNNRQCKTTTIVDGTYCRYHSQDPKYVQIRSEMGVKGGSSRKGFRMDMTKFKARDASDMVFALSKIIESVVQGKQEFSPAMQRYFPQYVKLFLEAKHQATTEKQIEEIQQKLQQQQKK